MTLFEQLKKSPDALAEYAIVENVFMNKVYATYDKAFEALKEIFDKIISSEETLAKCLIFYGYDCLGDKRISDIYIQSAVIEDEIFLERSRSHRSNGGETERGGGI